MSPPDCSVPAGRFPRRAAPWILAGVLAGIAAGVVCWFWLQPRQPGGVPAAVEALPSAGDRPAQLRERLVRAQQTARSSARHLAGVAELARLFYENGYLEPAEECWRYLIQAQPGEPRWPYYLADLQRQQGDETRIDILLRRVVELSPNYAPAWLRLADLAFKNGDFAAAERDYQQRLTLVPRDPYARLGLVRIAQQSGQQEKARALLEAMIRETPGFPPAHNLYAELLSARGDAVGARHQRWIGRESGRFRDADDPWLAELHAWCFEPKRLWFLGTIELQTGRTEQAVAFYERALELAPDDPVAYEVVGSAYLKMGAAARACEVLERGAGLKGGSAPPASLFVSLSEAYRVLHKPEEALRAAERGLKQFAAAAELHGARGVALSDLKRHDEAISAYEEALAGDANNALINYNLALSLLAVGRVDAAKVALKRSLVLQPTYLDSLRMLSGLELEAGDLAAAAKYLVPMYEANPGLADVKWFMAQWHLQAGDAAVARGEHAAAEREYLEGQQIEPAHPGLQVGLGTLYLTQGRFAESVVPLEAYARLEPRNPQCALYLGQAYARVGRIDDARRVLSEGEELARRLGRTETAAHCREVLDGL